MPVPNIIGERLEEVVDFEFATQHAPNVRQSLTVNLCDRFLEPLTDEIEKFAPKEDEKEEKETEGVEDKLGIIKTMAAYLKSPELTKVFLSRNQTLNAVMPFISAIEVSDWEKRDVPICISFGFPRKVPLRLHARARSNKLLELISGHIEKMFPNRKIYDLEQNAAAKVPYLLFDVDDVSVIIKISVKPFGCEQYSAEEIISIYKGYDDRFLTIANYFHHYLTQKAINKRDVRKAKSVIPKLTSIQMMVVHCFKHYGFLPSGTRSLAEMMAGLTVHKKSQHSLGTLYLLFLDYYLDVVSLEEDYLEIGTGAIKQKADIGLTNHNILSIADVFDDHYPGERVNDILIFKKIIKASLLIIKKYLNNRTGDVLNDLRVIPMRPRNVEL